jgi:hypothetical protein
MLGEFSLDYGTFWDQKLFFLGGAHAWCRTPPVVHTSIILLTLGLAAGIHLAMSYSHLPRRIFARARRLSAGVWDMRMH